MSWLKNASYVDRCFLKRESLRFVHGNRPGEFNRVVNICAYDLFFNFVRIGIDIVANVLPLVTFHADSRAVLKRNDNFLFAQSGHDPGFAVEKKLFGRWIILNEHDLRTFAQPQFFFDGAHKCREFAVDFGPEYKLRRFQSIERRLIDRIGFCIVRGQRNVTRIFFRRKIGAYAFV